MSETHDQTIDLDEIYDQFIHDALATGCVWGLESDDGWALCPSSGNDEIEVMPLWSQPELAKVHCQQEWATYRPVPISLEELLDEWLPGMHEDVVLVGIDWDQQLDGEEVEPLDLLEDFDEAASEQAD